MITLNSKKIKYNLTTGNNLYDAMIEGYYNYVACNSFDDLICPCCKMKGYLHYHKEYERNLVYNDKGDISSSKISITVLVCDNCKQKGNCQKYHALLPDFIFPYHIYEASTIINVLYLRLIKEVQVENLLNKIGITHKLLYNWINKFNKYLLSASTILSTNNRNKEVLERIYILNESFLMEFYDKYHPYFLFRKTCVPLVIIP